MIKAFVREDFIGMRLAITLVNQPNSDSLDIQPLIMRFDVTEDGRASTRWEQFDPSTDVQPTLALATEYARVLADALHTFFSGADDARMLRKDYDDERKRVDRLTDTLCAVAREAATRREGS